MIKREKVYLSDVLSVPMASDLWSTDGQIISESKIKTYLKNGEFTPNEAVKLGKNWIVTRQGMERIFGSMPGNKTRE